MSELNKIEAAVTTAVATDMPELQNLPEPEPSNPLSLESLLPAAIINLGRVNFTSLDIVLGEPPGLIDSINRVHEEFFKYYKNLRSLDWDEQEFRYEMCIPEFDSASEDDSAIMIDTISWQWEADSIVANAIPQVIHHTITNTEVMLGYMQIIGNEGLHGLTYSEIGRMAFRDPNLVLNRVLQNEDLHGRLSEVTHIFAEGRQAALEFALGIKTKEEVFPTILLFFCALATLERCQFQPSFAITFGYGEEGRFMPIVNAVQKICQDELEVHIPFNMAVVRKIVSQEGGSKAFDAIRPRLITLLNQLNAVENAWIERTLEGRKCPETFSIESLKRFNDFSCTYMARFFEIEKSMEFELVDKNPISYMDKWINLSLVQTSPQEQENNQYKMDVVIRNDQDLLIVPTF